MKKIFRFIASIFRNKNRHKKSTKPKPLIEPIYPRPHPFHPRFDQYLIGTPYTHLHPIDIARSVIGEKEIKGAGHNAFIAHLHEHSGNLGTHSEGADYSDEIPHCSSFLNWLADMSGCKKSNNALASSWLSMGEKNKEDRVDEGDGIVLRFPRRNYHVTLSNRNFSMSSTIFHGLGSNQDDSIKVSIYETMHIKKVVKWKPKPGTVLAPIGFLKNKPAPNLPIGGLSESTR